MAIEPNAVGDRPLIDGTAYVHATAVIAGNVRIGPRVYVGPHATIRADELGPDGKVMPISIGEDANIQDSVVVHALGGTAVEVGPGTSVAHGAVVHGPCATGRNCFIGFNSVVYNAVLGDNVVVMHHSVVAGVSVTGGLYVASGMTLTHPDAVRVLPAASAPVLDFVARVRQANVRLAEAERRNQTARALGCTSEPSRGGNSGLLSRAAFPSDSVPAEEVGGCHGRPM